jgi:hypothetical protein
MARYKILARSVDTFGNAQKNIGISIYLAGTNNPATVYTTEVIITGISTTPQISTDNYGRFEFWVDTDDYDVTQKFDVISANLRYSDIDIFNARAHNVLTGLREDDHTQYANLTQSEKVSASWTFEEDTTFSKNVSAIGNIYGDRIYTKKLSPVSSYELTPKSYVDTINLSLSSNSLSISAASVEGDNRLYEYIDLQNSLQTLLLSASAKEDDNRIYEYVDLQNSLQSLQLSASAKEDDNRLYEYIDQNLNTLSNNLSGEIY